MTEEEFAQRVEDMQRDGFAILPDVLTQAECDEAQAGLDRLVPERGRGGTECSGAPVRRGLAAVANSVS